MKRTVSSLALSIVMLLLPVFSAVEAQTAAPETRPMPGAGAAVLLSAGELKWNDVEGFAGVKMAVLHGDPGKGPGHFFMKLPGGFSAGMHFHNADHWVAVIAGTLVLVPEGGAEKSLPAGSGFGFTGKKKHTTKCAEGADCVLFVDAQGMWDVVPVGTK